RLRPVAILWRDGTLVRLSSPTRLVNTYLIARVTPDQMSALNGYLDSHWDELLAVPDLMYIDAPIHSITVAHRGAVLSRMWLIGGSDPETRCLDKLRARVLDTPFDDKHMIQATDLDHWTGWSRTPIPDRK